MHTLTMPAPRLTPPSYSQARRPGLGSPPHSLPRPESSRHQVQKPALALARSAAHTMRHAFMRAGCRACARACPTRAQRTETTHSPTRPPGARGMPEPLFNLPPAPLSTAATSPARTPLQMVPKRPRPACFDQGAPATAGTAPHHTYASAQDKRMTITF